MCVQIMLGLVSHEPHFSLLREEVRFGKKAQKRLTTPDTVTFHLLHLSIMREYLDFEFGTLKVKCGRKREGEGGRGRGREGGREREGEGERERESMHFRDLCLPLFRISYRLSMTLRGSLMTGC